MSAESEEGIMLAEILTCLVEEVVESDVYVCQGNSGSYAETAKY
jgi:hypothetical protein